MSDDPTKNIPGDSKEISAKQDDDRINVLIGAVQSLAADFQALSADFREVKVRLTAIQEIKLRIEALEKTVTERSFETKPIWERALAEIVATRVELAEVRAELAETRAEVKAEIADVRTELAGTRADLKAEIADVRTELRTEMEDGFRKLISKIELLTDDSLTVRADQRYLNRRVEALESKTS